MKRKEKRKPTPAKGPRALRQGSLTSKDGKGHISEIMFARCFKHQSQQTAQRALQGNWERAMLTSGHGCFAMDAVTISSECTYQTAKS
eukprot:1159068-Pelagomonas_calceolata.AAC.3